MTKLFDEIHEELKREDFLRRAFKFLPFALVVSLLTLGGVGVHTWRSYVQEKQLYTLERTYKIAVDALEAGDLETAAKVFASLEGTPGGMGFLAQVHKVGFAHDDFKAQGSQETWHKLCGAYEGLMGHIPSSCLQTFLQASWALMDISGTGALGDAKGSLPASVAQSLKDFGEATHSWYPFSLVYNTLKAFTTSSADFQALCAAWEKHTPKDRHYYWLPLYASMGAGIGRQLEESQGPAHAATP